MRLLRLAVRRKLLVAVAAAASLAVLVTGGVASTTQPAGEAGSATQAAPRRATETFTVSPTSADPVSSATVLLRSHTYRISVSGEVSDWCPEDAKSKEDCDFNGLPGTFEIGKGVDALYCYATWRCPTPQLWRQLRINRKGLDELVGDLLPVYEKSHTYTEKASGIAGKLSFVSSDASPENDSGKWTVTITDLGKTVYTVNYDFSARDSHGRTAHGRGTLSGTNLDELNPGKQGKKDNVISSSAPETAEGGGRVELRVISASYRHRTGHSKRLNLHARVVFSTSDNCGEGEKVIVNLADKADDFRVTDCHSLYPSASGSSDVEIFITPRP